MQPHNAVDEAQPIPKPLRSVSSADTKAKVGLPPLASMRDVMAREKWLRLANRFLGSLVPIRPESHAAGCIRADRRISFFVRGAALSLPRRRQTINAIREPINTIRELLAAAMPTSVLLNPHETDGQQQCNSRRFVGPAKLESQPFSGTINSSQQCRQETPAE